MVKECDKKAVRGPKSRKLSLKNRNQGFSSVEFGLTRKEAVKEAQRCLGLRECESCEICSLLCPDLCITRDKKTGEVLIDLDYCKGCGICASVCPKGAIEMALEEGIGSRGCYSVGFIDGSGGISNSKRLAPEP